MLHLGTLGAVMVFYRKDLEALLTGLPARSEAGHEARRYIGLILWGSVPAGVVGVLFADRVENAFSQLGFVLVALAVTGLLLKLSDRIPRRELPLNARIAFLVGCAQALAILPGFSRSGWTIVAGLFLGLAPKESARFSFLLSIPAILGATLLQLLQFQGEHSPWGALVPAMLLAFVVGLLCLSWLVRLVQNMSLGRFAYYLWAVCLGVALGLMLV
jgi:undecaprenyl-diphosphatase